MSILEAQASLTLFGALLAGAQELAGTLVEARRQGLITQEEYQHAQAGAEALRARLEKLRSQAGRPA